MLVDPANARGFKGASVVMQTETPPPIEEDGVELVWIENQGEYEVEGVRIRGWTLEHQKGKEGVVTVQGYLFGLEGIEVGILGKISQMPKPEIIEHFHDADVLILPGGGSPQISEAEASRLVRQIEPNIVIPSESKAEPKKFFAELGMKPKTEEKLVLKPKDLSAGTLQAIYLKP